MAKSTRKSSTSNANPPTELVATVAATSTATTITTVEPSDQSEPSLVSTSTQNQHVHFSETAVEISGTETNSVATNMNDRLVNPVDCESDSSATGAANSRGSGVVDRTRGRPPKDEATIVKASSSKKRAAPSSDNDDEKDVVVGNGHDDEQVDEKKPAKRTKKTTPTKTKRTSKKNKKDASADEEGVEAEAENEDVVSKPTRPKRAKSPPIYIPLKDESEDEAAQADAESAAESEESTTKKKKGIGKKKPNRVFSHAKAQTETKSKSKGKKKSKAGDDAEEEDFGAIMEKYWERAKRTGKYVGAHISMAGGVEKSITNAVHIGGTAFAIFLKNHRKWDSSPYPDRASDRFKAACEKGGFDPTHHVLPHGSYLINLCTADEAMRTKSYGSFVDDLKRCEMLGIGRYNFHSGSTKNHCTEEQGIANLVGCLNKALNETSFVTIVIENMAGQGAVMGCTFEQLKAMIDGVTDKSRIGICLDTCHLWAAGFDISTKAGYEKVMNDFENIVGFKYLKGIHINDCKEGLGNKADRHDNIGKGKIGLEAFRCLMNDPRMNGIPMVLETPNGDDESGKVWKDEIERLYSLVEGEPALAK